MSSSAQPVTQQIDRYRPRPTVMKALRSPKILTREALAGLVVALALIPEAISFSIVAGVDPRVGLFSSFIMAVTIAFVGGRPAMITAATGAIALVIAPVMREPESLGIDPDRAFDYFIATVLLAGVIQILLGLLGVAKLMRFIPRSVMIGFVNALAILIFMAQVEHLVDVPFAVYWLIAIGLIILVFWPKLTKAIPGPLISILVVTAFVLIAGINVPTVSDQGNLPDSLPELFVPNVPLTFETLQIIAPFAFSMAMVGIMESLMTAKLVDEVTDSHSNKTRETWGQGIANLASGLIGGMGGCAMIGQSMINVKVSGARTRISTFLAGVFLLILVVSLGDWVGEIPMAALVAVMIMVCVSTFDWHSIKPATLKRMPLSETMVMVSTVVVVVATNNLAYGVFVGVIVASVLFVRRVAHLFNIDRKVFESEGVSSVRYVVNGHLLFASSNDLTTQFEYTLDPDHVVIDLSQAHVWDASTVAALDTIQTKYAEQDKTVEIYGMNEDSEQMHQRLTGTLNED